MSSARLNIKVIPKSARFAIVVQNDSEIKVKIHSVAEKGAANAELIDRLSQKLDMPKSQIKIVTGHTFRHKLIHIDGIEKDEAIRRLKIES